MDKSVIISIRGKQSLQDAGDETIELVTEGVLSKTEKGYALSYQESQLTGLEGTTTTFQVEGNQVTLLRTGAVNSQMVFQQGRQHLSLYNTPYGSLSIGVSTRRIRSTLDDCGGELLIDYAIQIGSDAAGENFFQISVRERKMPSAGTQDAPAR